MLQTTLAFGSFHSEVAFTTISVQVIVSRACLHFRPKSCLRYCFTVGLCIVAQAFKFLRFCPGTASSRLNRCGREYPYDLPKLLGCCKKYHLVRSRPSN